TRKLLAAAGRPQARIAPEVGILPPSPQAIGETGQCTPEAQAALRYVPGDKRLETAPDITLISMR
ncbi:MAG: hypothetical protein ACRCWO_11115, partial [Bosea sp. (in: a-proteobacteria)]